MEFSIVFFNILIVLSIVNNGNVVAEGTERDEIVSSWKIKCSLKLENNTVSHNLFVSCAHAQITNLNLLGKHHLQEL